jgi:hypothetical protein
MGECAAWFDALTFVVERVLVEKDTILSFFTNDGKVRGAT